MLLKVDQTLLMMKTDNIEKKIIIHLAIENNRTNIVRFLVGDPALFRLNRQKPSPSMADPINQTAQSIPTNLMNTTETAEQSDSKVNLNILTVKNGQGNTAVHMLVETGQKAMIKWVLN